MCVWVYGRGETLSSSKVFPTGNFLTSKVFPTGNFLNPLDTCRSFYHQLLLTRSAFNK